MFFVRILFLIFVFFVSSAFADELIHVGKTAPDFNLKDINGKNYGLRDFSSKKALIIVFWTTWSGRSQDALKRFDAYYRKYSGKDIQVIGINAEQQTISTHDLAKIKAFVDGLNVSFPILIDEGLNVFHGYGVVALPSTVVLSGGKVAYELPGFPLVRSEEMFEYLAELAGERPRQKTAVGYTARYDAISDMNLAMEFVKKKRYEMAYPFFNKAIDKDPKYMLPYIELSKLYELEQKHAEAEAALRKGLAQDPESAAVMARLGYLLAKTGRAEAAMELLQNAVKSGAYLPSEYYMAYALGKKGRLKESLDAFSSAIGKIPGNSSAYLLRAEIYEEQRMFKEAAADYRKALEKILVVR
ncbi:MAG: redoxin domain-containing protein [Nitrospirae bacterium]|nr:MAG: redoxin domain-containing protein [Nitrospirota bacterium]